MRACRSAPNRKARREETACHHDRERRRRAVRHCRRRLAATDRRGADETGSEDKTGAIAPDDNGEGEKPSSLCPPVPLDKLRRETRKTRPTLKIDQSDLATQTTSWRRRQNSWRQKSPDDFCATPPNALVKLLRKNFALMTLNKYLFCIGDICSALT